jgi:DUF1365 family protein
LGGLFVFSLILSDVKRKFAQRKNFVTPAKAGAQSVVVFEYTKDWVPAFAGMTKFLIRRISKRHYLRAVQAKSASKARQC